jgi:hypothetical protein
MVTPGQTIVIGATVMRKGDIKAGYTTRGTVLGIFEPNPYHRHRRAEILWKRRGCRANHSTVRLSELVVVD